MLEHPQVRLLYVETCRLDEQGWDNIAAIYTNDCTVSPYVIACSRIIIVIARKRYEMSWPYSHWLQNLSLLHE